MADTENGLYNIAYKKLKQTIYYDTDLILKKKFAEFESEELDCLFSDDKFHLQGIFNTLESKKTLSEEQRSYIDQWIDQIDFYVLPKSVSPFSSKEEMKKREKKEETEVSNVVSSETYYWHGVNYHSNIPIPLMLLDVLWIMKVGVYLDEKLSDHCFGNRVHEILHERKERDASGHLMKMYAKQYTAWRNNAMKCAVEAVEKDDIVDILTLDFTQFFYHIEGDFGEIREFLQELKNSPKFKGNYRVASILTDILEKIHEKYYDKISIYTDVTHVTIKEHGLRHVLPIGMYSSGILANWHLKWFDKKVLECIRPRYYGRYVDDCIFVLAEPRCGGDAASSVSNDCSKRNILEKLFVDAGILSDFSGGSVQCDLKWRRLPDLENGKDIVYRLCDLRFEIPRITVQNDKVMLYHVDPDHSTAILRLFLKKIQENASVFQYLPKESVLESQDTGMHQLVFADGSTHKLRNLKKLMVDNSKFSITLSKQLSHISLCSKPIPKIDEFTKNMFRDLRGNNYLTYTRVWEKVFCLLLFSKKEEQIQEACKMYDELLGQISRLECAYDFGNKKSRSKNENNLFGELKKRLLSTLIQYLKLSVAIPLSLFSEKDRKERAGRFSDISELYSPKNINSIDINGLNALADRFRSTNLFPQQYVIYPLLNYLKEYDGDLLDIDVFNTDLLKNPELDAGKLDLSPRFIHLYEYQLFYALSSLKTEHNLTDCPAGNPNAFDCEELKCCYMQKANHEFLLKTFKGWADSSFSNVKISSLPSVQFTDMKVVHPTKITITSDDSRDPKMKGKIRIGLANLRISEERYEKCHAPQELAPDISLERWLEISRVLNAAVDDKCDLVIFPECAIPHYWLPKLAQWSKQHQIGLIFGLEYVFDCQAPHSLSLDKTNENRCIAFNLTAALLPFQVKNLYKSCCVSLRVKNHYAPGEIFQLENYGYSLPNLNSHVYHLYKWRKAQFTVYNCFELADIQHRALFRSELDYLIACSFNKDIHYFMDILDSVVRDVHCYVVYSNTSEFGCSRILRPTKHELKNMMQVGGGVNCTLLAGDLDIEALAKFQSHGYDKTDDSFKALPPGFNSAKVVMRHKHN
ncbi:hypothetical protein [Methanorbis rubei]|uniref:Reverse transcriptase domain-containing protein n=1 Tax=Methanorbis rubei TaxID=3028300 RepID=A0AAE4MFM6_9EURY|nr:hypothetical protein [Methanocorpusculaceae archaeon Cs1]